MQWHGCVSSLRRPRTTCSPTAPYILSLHVTHFTSIRPFHKPLYTHHLPFFPCHVVVGYFLSHECWRWWCDAFGPLVAQLCRGIAIEATLNWKHFVFPPPSTLLRVHVQVYILQWKEKKAIGAPWQLILRLPFNFYFSFFWFFFFFFICIANFESVLVFFLYCWIVDEKKNYSAK